MAGPVRIPDRIAYKGDPYTMRTVWQNPDGSPKDVSDADWTINSLFPFTTDASQAVDGVVYFTAPPEATGDPNCPPLVRWDLAEANIWGQTVLEGRLIMEDQVTE